jgi:NitT/TauT family transport system ATP-binding protein
MILKNISKSFGDKTVLNNLSVEFKNGSRTCIMGASGSGKTTLLNIVMGLIRPDGGELFDMPKRISAVFQEDRLCEPYSAVKNVFAVTGKEISEASIVSLLNDLKLTGSEYLPVSTLSGGMRRRVALARALLARGDVLILDEPFKGLDEETRAEVIGVINRHTAGKTLIVSTHDIRDASDLGAEIFNL